MPHRELLEDRIRSDAAQWPSCLPKGTERLPKLPYQDLHPREPHQPGPIAEGFQKGSKIILRACPSERTCTETDVNCGWVHSDWRLFHYWWRAGVEKEVLWRRCTERLDWRSDSSVESKKRDATNGQQSCRAHRPSNQREQEVLQNIQQIIQLRQARDIHFPGGWLSWCIDQRSGRSQ